MAKKASSGEVQARSSTEEDIMQRRRERRKRRMDRNAVAGYNFFNQLPKKQVVRRRKTKLKRMIDRKKSELVFECRNKKWCFEIYRDFYYRTVVLKQHLILYLFFQVGTYVLIKYNCC